MSRWVLLLGSVLWASPGLASASECTAAATQAEINRCAYEDFLAANGQQAQRIKDLNARLDVVQRRKFRAAQKAWIGWRTAQCEFESASAAGGSLREALRWQCASRLVVERTAMLERQMQCPEGDIACVAPKR